MINNNIGSSDVVKCSKPQIWSFSHKVFQTPSYLSHLWCMLRRYNTRNQGYRPIDLLDKETCLNYCLLIYPPACFLCWDILVFFLILILKFSATAVIGLYFRSLWRNWLNFFVIKKNVQSMTEKWSKTTKPPAHLQAQDEENVGPHLLLNLDLELQRNQKSLIDPAANPYSNANCFLICMNRATKKFEHFVVQHCLTKFFTWRLGWQSFT